MIKLSGKLFCNFILLFIFSITFYFNAFADQKGNDNEFNIRKPAFAGKFYPEDAVQLKQSITNFLDLASTPSKERPIAIISPHAGYIYSGQIMADAFKEASIHDYDLIVLLGTNHTSSFFSGVSIYAKGGFQTPIGTAKIDEEIAQKLLDADKENYSFDTSIHKEEHSIEVLVPFVISIFPNIKILPAIIGKPDPDLCLKFGADLSSLLKGRKPLIVASSDLSHYPSYEVAKKADRETLLSVCELDPKVFHDYIKKNFNIYQDKLSTFACGEAPIMAAMAAAKRLGANCARIINYANSGDVSIGDRLRVVGYGAVSFTKTDKCQVDKDQSKLEILSSTESTSNELSKQNKKALLSFARKNIEQFLSSQTTPLARGFDPTLEKLQGAFVTLKKKGELRGCIGHMAEDLPLCQVVGSMALQAAFGDPRFKPVQINELSEIEIEISVLTPVKAVGGISDIKLGIDGVIIKKDGRSGVFLPQVALEQNWTKEEMLKNLCYKAGLSGDCWKNYAQFFTFQAIVFNENEIK